MTNKKQNKLEELQKRLDKLKQKQEPKEKTLGLEIQQHGRLPGLGAQFEEVGKTMGQLKDLIPKRKPNNNPQQQLPDDPLVAKFRKWILIGLTILIGGGAAIMVVVKVIGRIFG